MIKIVKKATAFFGIKYYDVVSNNVSVFVGSDFWGISERKIGEIKFSGFDKEFVFYPAKRITFDAKTLRNIAKAVEDLNKKR